HLAEEFPRSEHRQRDFAVAYPLGYVHPAGADHVHGLPAISFAEQHGPGRMSADEVLDAGQSLAHETPATLASGPVPANETAAGFVVEAGAYAPGWESHRDRRRIGRTGVRARVGKRVHPPRSGGPAGR